MDELTSLAAKVSTLFGISLEMVKHDEPVVGYDDFGDLVHDYTIPYSVRLAMTDERSQLLTPRVDFSAARMFLHGMYVLGHRARVEFDREYQV